MSTQPGNRSSSGVHHDGVPSAVSMAASKPSKVAGAHTGVQTKIKVVRPVGAPKPRNNSSSASGKGSPAPPRTTRGTHKARVRPKHGPNLDTTRSANDKKHYRHVTLANGLECVLISTLNAPDSKVGASVGPDGLTNFASSMDIAINDAADNLNGTTEGHTHMHGHGHAHTISKGALGMRRNQSLVKEFNSRPTSLVDGSSMLPPVLRIPSRRMMAVDQVEATELVAGGETAAGSGTAHSRSRTLSGRLASANLRRSGRSSGRFAVGGGAESNGYISSSGGEGTGEDDVVVELDSTSRAVQQLHARAFSESQQNLHATAEEIVQEAKLKRKMGRGSKGAVNLPLNSQKTDRDRPPGISHRVMGSSARGLVLSTGEAGGGRSSVGTSKRSSIPSLSIAASLAAASTGRGLMRTNTAGSGMNLFDVPHLDRPGKSAQAAAQQARISSRIQSQGRMAAASSVSVSGDMDEQPEVVGVRMAAVSLAVGVGSFSTPDGFDGLAHFLEHMLFMGSERFPAENAFDAFLAQAGGNSNAYTDTEKTVYHFTCPQEHLRHALDIFAQFFISPLLLPEAADRELKSIESEFTLRQNMDGCRLQEIWRHTSREGTPFAKFTCGNMQTLRDWPLAAGRDVNKALWSFYKKYYVAPNMKLCILGIDSLDALEGLSIDLFSPVRESPIVSSSSPTKYSAVDFSERGVPWVGLDPSVQSLAQVWPQIIKAQREKRNLPDVLSELETQRVNGGVVVSADADVVATKNDKRKSGTRRKSRRRSKTRNLEDDTEAAAAAAAATKPPLAGEDGVALGCLFRIVPVQDMHELSLTWQLPPLAGLYMSKPTEYISHLIGHESAGSILAEAKARGWATALIASSVTGDGFEHNTACTMFNINVTLTRQGLNEWVYVVGMIFEYIGMLIRVGPQKRVYDELRAVSKMQYEFQEEPDALMLAQNLSVWMLPQSKYKPEHLLTGPWLNFDWDPVLINNTLHQLSPKLVRLDLMSSVYGHSDEYQNNERSGGGATPIPEPIDAEKNSEDSIDWLSERPTRVPISEPFTGAQYWVDKIPDSVTSLWKELFLGRATVGFTESTGEEKSAGPNPTGNNKDGNSFPRSLALPPRNPYISTDFSLRKPPASDAKHPLVGAVIKVCRPIELLGSVAVDHTVPLKRSESLQRSSISESGTTDSRVMSSSSSSSRKKNRFLRASMDKHSGATEWTKASILEVNERDNMILVQYALGEYRWHELPREKVDWKSMPSPLSTRHVSALKKLLLDGSIKFEFISMPNNNKSSKKKHIENKNDADEAEESGGNKSRRSRGREGKGRWSKRRSTSRKGRKGESSGVKKMASDRARAESNFDELADSSTALVTFSQFGGAAANSVDAGPAASTNKRRTPAMVAHSDNLFTLWHLQDLEFRTPRCEVYLNFVSPVANASPLLASLHDLLALMIFESLNQDSYMAFISELELEIETSGTGLQVHVGGFSHKLPVLLDNVINRLLQFAMLDREHDTGAIINLADSALSAAARKSGRKSGRGHGRENTTTSIGSNLSRISRKNKIDTRSMRYMRDSTSSILSNKQRVGSTGTGGINKRTSKITRSGPQQEQQQRQVAGAGAMMPTQLIESPVFYAQLESLVTNYINAGSQFRSSGQVSTAMFQILCRDLWSPDVKVSFAAYITPNLLKEYAVKFLSECRVQGLVYGNITLGESQNMLHKVKDALHNAGIEPIAENKIPVLDVLEVPIAPPLVRNSTIHGMVHVLEALESPAHSVELYFQIGDDVLEERVLACTIEQIMKEPLYAELRTKQQLGYSVKCGVRSICGTLGFVVEITSEVHGPELLCQDVDNFLTTFRESLANISETDLSNHVAALSRNLTEKENGLGETALKFWNTVANKQHHKPPRYAWHYEVEQAQALERRVTGERLLNSFDKWLSPASTQRRRLSVLVVGFGYDTAELVRMLEMPCVTLVESAQETHDAEAERAKACRCSIM